MRTFRDKADQVNPYFMMQEFNFRILNSDKYELNNAIKKFNKLIKNQRQMAKKKALSLKRANPE